ncbi:MAG: hypothetical protein ACKOWG_09340, partial [Planctomycetia bacterium]
MRKLFPKWIPLVALAVLATGLGHAREPESQGPLPVPDLSTRPGEDWGTFLGPTGNGRSSLTG